MKHWTLSELAKAKQRMLSELLKAKPGFEFSNAEESLPVGIQIQIQKIYFTSYMWNMTQHKPFKAFITTNNGRFNKITDKH